MAWSGFRSAFKGNPQQGTIFDVRDVPSVPVRSEGNLRRERRREIVDAMPQVRGGHLNPERRQRVMNTVGARVPVKEGDVGGARALGARYRTGADMEARASLGRRLADESTVPADTLEGLSAIRVNDRSRNHGKGVVGEYVRSQSLFDVDDDPTIYTKHDSDDLPLDTLVHELGHHDSLYHQGRSLLDGQAAYLAGGGTINLTEEGRADVFALSHTSARVGKTYGNLVKGLGETEYVKEREKGGFPLTRDERIHQGLEVEDEAPKPVQEELF